MIDDGRERLLVDLDEELVKRMNLVHDYETALARRVGRWPVPASPMHSLIGFAWARLQYRLETYGSLAAAVEAEAVQHEAAHSDWGEH